MPNKQLARGLWTEFAQREAPFAVPNGMHENLRVIDDHLAGYSMSEPVEPGTPLPVDPQDGESVLYTDGSYAVFNGGEWKEYPPMKGMAFGVLERSLGVEKGLFFCTGSAWKPVDEHLKALLSGSDGASAVGVDGITMRDVALTLRPIPNYGALRDYSGFASAVRITDPRTAGVFDLDADDTTTTDDGVVVIVDSLGRRWKRQHSGIVNFAWAGAVDGPENDCSAAWARAVAVCESGGFSLMIPHTDTAFYIATGTTHTKKLSVFGAFGGAVNAYFGTQTRGSRIIYTGPDWLIRADPDLAAGSAVDGTNYSDLIVLGTDAALGGIECGRPEWRHDPNKSSSQFSMSRIYLGDFRHGYGARICNTFSNQLTDVNVQNCGVCLDLQNTHATRIIGGNIEQSLVGINAINSYGVALFGTCVQGIYAARAGQLGLAVPDDMFVWPGGWDGTGYLGILKTEPWQYAGTAIRNFGSIITVDGTYWEKNDYSILAELSSVTSVRGGIAAQDDTTVAFVLAGNGAVSVEGVAFQTENVSFGTYVGLIVNEHNGISLQFGADNVFDTALAAATAVVGMRDWIGNVDQSLQTRFSLRQRQQRTIETYSRQLIPTTTGGGAATIDIGALAATYLQHSVDGGGSVVYTVSTFPSMEDGDRINLRLRAVGSDFNAVFPINEFKVEGGPSVLIGAGTQAVFEFECISSVWHELYSKRNIPA